MPDFSAPSLREGLRTTDLLDVCEVLHDLHVSQHVHYTGTWRGGWVKETLWWWVAAVLG